MFRYQDEEITNEIISSAIQVHKTLGPGLLESAHAQFISRREMNSKSVVLGPAVGSGFQAQFPGKKQRVVRGTRLR
ncbi:MAG: hypothetical protein HY069_02475 [Chlamydiia bacterium]|nr:hypothetical protein [Chlamydiia bacterium]